MNIDLDALEKAAKEATPSPRKYKLITEQDRYLIKVLTPEVVLELIRRLREAEKQK